MLPFLSVFGYYRQQLDLYPFCQRSQINMYILYIHTYNLESIYINSVVYLGKYSIIYAHIFDISEMWHHECNIYTYMQNIYIWTFIYRRMWVCECVSLCVTWRNGWNALQNFVHTKRDTLMPFTFSVSLVSIQWACLFDTPSTQYAIYHIPHSVSSRPCNQNMYYGHQAWILCDCVRKASIFRPFDILPCPTFRVSLKLCHVLDLCYSCSLDSLCFAFFEETKSVWSPIFFDSNYSWCYYHFIYVYIVYMALW